MNIQVHSYMLEEGEKLPLKEVLLYIAAGTGELVTNINQGQNHLSAGKSYWIERDASIMASSKDLLKLFTVSVPKNLYSQLDNGPLSTIQPAKMVPILEELLELESGPLYRSKVSFKQNIRVY